MIDYVDYTVTNMQMSRGSDYVSFKYCVVEL